jgi:hypothetical protein
MSSVQAVLYRRTYLGEIVYGQTPKQDLGGQRKYQRRPESEWLRVPQPAWRIVSDAAREAAHTRLQAAAQTYCRVNKGTLWGRPATGLDAKYLLAHRALWGTQDLRCECSRPAAKAPTTSLVSFLSSQSELVGSWSDIGSGGQKQGLIGHADRLGLRLG